MHRFYIVGVLSLAALYAGSAFANEAPLSLGEAVLTATTADDPRLLRHDEKVAALEDHAVADAQLPDPTIRGSVANLSTDTFRFAQENMTQAQFTLRQTFPAGRTLSLRGERRQGEADVERARRDLALREIEMSVRTAWFDLFYLTKAQASVRESRKTVRELVQSLHASYVVGALATQDISRAELELALLDDKLTDLKRQEEEVQADLSRFLGADALRPLSGSLPVLPTPPSFQQMEAMLPRHPIVLIEDVEIGIGDTEVELAEQAYAPSWALEGGYGARGGGRSDLASIGVTLSIPFFTGDRQDRRLSAAVRQRGAAQFDRAAKLLDLRRDLGRAHADWRLLGERIQLYGDVVIERAKETAESSISTYSNGRTDFPEIIRSQLAQLDVELKRMELRTQRGKAWAQLAYLVGEME